MASRKHPDKLLAGSLNLLAPADQTPQGDSPILANWKLDQAGYLRSRHGSVVKATGLGGGTGAVHSLFRTGQDRYTAAGTSLLHGEAAATVVTRKYGTAHPDLELSGNPVDFCAYSGRTFIMDAVPVWVEGNQYAAWGIERPNIDPTPSTPDTAMVAAAGENVHTDIAGFEEPAGGAEAWEVFRFVDNEATEISPTPYSTNPADIQPTTGDVVSTKSLHLECNPPGRYYASWSPAAPGKNFVAGGVENDDDVIRLWVKCSNRDSLESMFITLVGGENSEKMVSCEVPIALLTPAVQAWTFLTIRRRIDANAVVTADPGYREILRRIDEARANGNAIDEQAQVQARDSLYNQILGRTLFFQDVTQNATFDWTAVTRINIEVTATDACDVFLDTLDVLGGVDAGAYEGEFRIAVTYGNGWGEESSLSDFTAPVTLRKQKLVISNIPVSGDPQVDHKNLYAVGGRFDRPLRIGQVLPDVTEKISDLDINDVIRLFEEGPITNDPPTPGDGLLEKPFMGRLVTWKDATVYWSEATQPCYWPEDNFEEVGDSGERIVKCTAPNDGELRVWKQRGLWRYAGDPANVQPDSYLEGIAAVGKRAICTALRRDFFVSADGVYEMADWPRKLSTKIEPLFANDHVDLGNNVIVPPIDKTKLGLIAIGYRDGYLWMSYPEVGQSGQTNHRTLTYHLESERWDTWIATAYPAFLCYFNEGSYEDYSGFLIAGTSNGRLVELDSGLTDAGAAIPLMWRSEYKDQGLPNIPKVYTELIVDGRTAIGTSGTAESPSTLNIRAVHSDGTSVFLGTFSSANWTTSEFRLPPPATPPTPDTHGLIADNFAIEISGNCSSTTIIRGVYLYWYPEAREGRVFDTQVFDLESEEADEVEEFRLIGTTSADVTANIYGDLANGSMALIEKLTLTHLAGAHRTYPIRPSAGGPWMSRRWRAVLTSPSKFQVHQFKAHYREVGQYLAAGDVYDPGAMSLGG